MRARIALVLVLLAVTVGGMSVLSSFSLADTAQTYAWEQCAEGWTTTTNDAANGYPPGLGAWTRRAPGSGSNFSYNTGAYSSRQRIALVSPTYAWPGGPITVSFDIAHDVEPPGSTGTHFDFVALQWQVDTGTWTTAKSYAGQNAGYPDFIEEEQTFTAPAGALKIRFQFQSDNIFDSVTDDWEGAFIDNVFIPLPKPQGTSCAGGGPSASPSGSPSPSPTDGGGECTIVGTQYGDHLDGTEGDDVICGRGGDDVIDGLGGDDLIKGGDGDDTLRGNSGSDELRGAKGNDELRGGSGNDELRGGKHDDELRGGSGTDDCRGGKGSDRFSSCE